MGCGDDLPRLSVATAEQGVVLSPGNTHPIIFSISIVLVAFTVYPEAS